MVNDETEAESTHLAVQDDQAWTALEDRTFSPLLQCCLTVPYSYSGP